MTLQDVLNRLKAIESESGDPEVAHVLEDELFLDFIRDVASRPGPDREVAANILTVKNIEFERWYA